MLKGEQVKNAAKFSKIHRVPIVRDEVRVSAEIEKAKFVFFRTQIKKCIV